MTTQRGWTPEDTSPPPTSRYDQRLAAIRHQLAAEHTPGKVVADLGCGIGTYLAPRLDTVVRAYAIDHDPRVVAAIRARYTTHKLTALVADMADLPLASESIDTAIAYSSLYLAPLPPVTAETGRVLKPGGTAIFDFGNRRSLHALAYQHGRYPPPRQVNSTIREARSALTAARLRVFEWRSFQILPLTGVAPGIKWLYPLAHPAWKHLLGVTVAGRMADEWVSRLLRPIAYRHLVIVRKQG